MRGRGSILLVLLLFYSYIRISFVYRDKNETILDIRKPPPYAPGAWKETVKSDSAESNISRGSVVKQSKTSSSDTSDQKHSRGSSSGSSLSDSESYYDSDSVDSDASSYSTGPISESDASLDKADIL